MFQNNKNTICAISTPTGKGAISIIRVTGNYCLKICNKIFKKKIPENEPNTIHKNKIVHNKQIIDEVMVSFFKNPKSYTGEDMIEIYCHGSLFIQNKIMQILIGHGIKTAKPGEFTMRAFLNNKLNLTESEAVCDLINSENEAAHNIAIRQLRGGISNEIKKLRQELIDFVSLIELEIDFSEEDVEFADRKKLIILLENIELKINKLIKSFKYGNAIKEGIPIVIAGKPNVGKSTLLNCFLNEEKAITSSIAGTTRDIIEDKININGYNIRFFDTAGIRKAKGKIEKIGITKSLEKIEQAELVIYMIDVTSKKSMIEEEVKNIKRKYKDKKIIIVGNKIDLNQNNNSKSNNNIISISAKNKNNIEEIINKITDYIKSKNTEHNVIISNTRHFECLSLASNNITSAKQGIENNLSQDLISIDIRSILSNLGEIAGEVSNEDILSNIFSNFCIGK